MTEKEIGTIIVDAAIALHCELGPGLLEGVYECPGARTPGAGTLRRTAGTNPHGVYCV